MRRHVVLLALLMIASSCSLINRGDTADTPIPKIPVEKHTLANGLEVLLVEDHRLPQVSVDIWYHVGPVNEEKGRTGFAHLFEHMMFQKSKHIPEDSYFRFLEGAGASGVNGTTSFDRTNYYELFRATNSSWHYGWSPTAWAICWMTSPKPPSGISRTLSATNVARTLRIVPTALSKRRVALDVSERPSLLRRTSLARTRTFRQRN